MPELNDTEVRALEEALDDEYRARATYDQVIRDFGPVLPFTRIREAEERHINALQCAAQAVYALRPPGAEKPLAGKGLALHQPAESLRGLELRQR